jgi:Flp pilus assembly protein CpaB
VEGEAFKDGCFASASSGYRVASVLPEGMRAMTLSLSDYGGLYGILYAGCYVDVLTSFRLPGNAESGKSEAMSMPLLQGVQVLAVEENTLVSEKEEPEGKRSGSSRSKKLLVTLMVDLEQASGLQLALQYGTVSLALRNPLDVAKVKRNQSLLSKLSQGQVGLKRLAAQLKPVPGSGDAVASASTIPAPGEQPVDANAPAVPAFVDEGLTVDPDMGAVLFPTGGNASPAANDLWKVTILRGNVITTQSLAIPSETGK